MKSERDLFNEWLKYYENHDVKIDQLQRAFMWQAWQARVPDGYKLVPVETLEECLSWACCASSESWNDEQRDEIDKHYKVIEKAMIGAAE